MTHPPDIVALTFDKDDTEGWYSVVVRNVDGVLVCAGPLKVINDWLLRHDYKWITGTDGLWRRDA